MKRLGQILLSLLLAFSFLVSVNAETNKPLPDADFEIQKNTEIMVLIDERGRAKEIKDEWSVDIPKKKKKVSKKKKRSKKKYSKKKKRKKKKRGVASKKKKKRKSKKR